MIKNKEILVLDRFMILQRIRKVEVVIKKMSHQPLKEIIEKVLHPNHQKVTLKNLNKIMDLLKTTMRN